MNPAIIAGKNPTSSNNGPATNDNAPATAAVTAMTDCMPGERLENPSANFCIRPMIIVTAGISASPIPSTVCANVSFNADT
ncbi:hypothetical protein D3C84_1189470 [compost metagenome]